MSDMVFTKMRRRSAELAGMPNMPLEATAGKGPFQSLRRALTRRASAAGRYALGS